MEISFINDEFSNDIDDALNFAKKNHLKYIELRRINGQELTDFPKEKLFELSSKIAGAGILVSAIASNFLLWTRGTTSFKICGQHIDSEEDYFTNLMDIADIFGAPNIRIYSYLKDKRLSLEELGKKLDQYSQMALDRGITLLLENKKECNIFSVNSIHKLLELYNFSNIYPLLDLGETVASSDNYNPQELQDIINNCLYFHIKDYDTDLKRYVVFGEGNVDYEDIIADKQNDKAVIFSLTPQTGYPEDLQMSLNILISSLDED